MAAIVFMFGGKTLRGLLADIRWGWNSDELDAGQRRRHEDEDHQIGLCRKMLELEREFPDGAARVREIEPGGKAVRPELPRPEEED